jgi:hypothetical protein
MASFVLPDRAALSGLPSGRFVRQHEDKAWKQPIIKSLSSWQRFWEESMSMRIPHPQEARIKKRAE